MGHVAVVVGVVDVEGNDRVFEGVDSRVQECGVYLCSDRHKNCAWASNSGIFSVRGSLDITLQGSN